MFNCFAFLRYPALHSLRTSNAHFRKVQVSLPVAEHLKINFFLEIAKSHHKVPYNFPPKNTVKKDVHAKFVNFMYYWVHVL